MSTQNPSTRSVQRVIGAGSVVRWFYVDWEFFGDTRAALERHDEIFELLGSMRGAVEVNSGHTGVNVAFENIRRTNSQVAREIKRRLTPLVSRDEPKAD